MDSHQKHNLDALKQILDIWVKDGNQEQIKHTMDLIHKQMASIQVQMTEAPQKAEHGNEERFHKIDKSTKKAKETIAQCRERISELEEKVISLQDDIVKLEIRHGLVQEKADRQAVELSHARKNNDFAWSIVKRVEERAAKVEKLAEELQDHIEEFNNDVASERKSYYDWCWDPTEANNAADSTEAEAVLDDMMHEGLEGNGLYAESLADEHEGGTNQTLGWGVPDASDEQLSDGDETDREGVVAAELPANEAEERVANAEKRALDAEERAGQAWASCAAAYKQLAEANQRVMDAEKRAKQTEKRIEKTGESATDDKDATDDDCGYATEGEDSRSSETELYSIDDLNTPSEKEVDRSAGLMKCLAPFVDRNAEAKKDHEAKRVVPVSLFGPIPEVSMQ